MSWILFILFGLVIGLLARALVPGKQKVGILWTLAIGVAGALLGGWLAGMITGDPIRTLSVANFIGSVLGAVVLLLAYVAITRRTSGGHIGGPGHRKEIHTR